MKSIGSRCRIFRPGPCVGFLFAMIAGYFVSPSPAMAADKIVLGVPSPPSITHSPWWMAVGMGYSKQEGLALEIISFRGSAVLIPQVISKKIDVGWPNPDILILSRRPGRDYVPLKFFYNFTRRSPWEIAVPANSAIRTVTDLKGKTLGVGALTWGNIPITRSLLADAGLSAGKDVQLLPVGVGGPAFRAIKTGQVDALNLFGPMHAILETTGYKIRRLALKPKFTGLFANGMLTHEDNLKNNRKKFAGFGRAIAKGSLACQAAIEACVRNYWKLNPAKVPKRGTKAQKLARSVKILDGHLRNVLPDPNARRMGAFPKKPWKDFVEIFHAAGLLSTTNIPVETVYTNELVPAFNDFDRAAVIRAAKAMP